MLNPEELLERQKPDGGWCYHAGQPGGASWTEPTCYALLALAASGLGDSDAVRRGARWLASTQNSEGGCVPRRSVRESTWVTALVLMLPPACSSGVDRNRAAAWLLRVTGRESGWVQRLRMRLLGAQVEPSQAFDGWPWYPGSGAWVTPTALSVLALEKLAGEQHDASIQGTLGERLSEGRAFLLGRRCRDGGWNHGSTRALGYDSDSYPETTGIALLALHAAAPEELTGAIAVAEQHLARCRSQEAASWLTLALLAHGRHPAAVDLPSHGGTIEIALAALAGCARSGSNPFLASS